MSFSDYLKRHIFQPLGMHDTRSNRRYLSDPISDYAYGYVYSSESKIYELPDHLPETDYVVFLDGIQGDGSVNSNLKDLFKWDRALYSEQLVSQQTLAEAFTPVILNNNETFDFFRLLCYIH